MPQPSSTLVLMLLNSRLQVGAVQHKHWDITLSAPSLALSLLYTAGELETASSNSHSFYAPRLVVEALSLTAGMHTEASSKCLMGC